MVATAMVYEKEKPFARKYEKALRRKPLKTKKKQFDCIVLVSLLLPEGKTRVAASCVDGLVAKTYYPTPFGRIVVTN